MKTKATTLTAADILANPISTPTLLIGSTIAIGSWAFGWSLGLVAGVIAIGVGLFAGSLKAMKGKDAILAQKTVEAKTEERREISAEYSRFKKQNANRKTENEWKDCLEDLNGILYLYNRVSPEELEAHIELVDPIHATFRQCMVTLKKCRELNDFAKRSPSGKEDIKGDFKEKLEEAKADIALLSRAVREFHAGEEEEPINPLDEVLEVRKRMKDREDRMSQQIDRE